MSINRHNYEEFFLLYVDNELTPEEKSAVENFVVENPDLRDELEMLRQTILGDENLAFEHKEQLYNYSEKINQENYEDWFLLAVDQELDDKESEELETFVLKHPQLQKEFLQLQQCRLEPEDIVFAGKDNLYKNRVIQPGAIVKTLSRLAVAAAFAGAAALTWLLIHNPPNDNRGPALVTQEVAKKSPREIIEQPPAKNGTIIASHLRQEPSVAQEKKPVLVRAKMEKKQPPVAMKPAVKVVLQKTDTGYHNLVVLPPVAGKTIAVEEPVALYKNERKNNSDTPLAIQVNANERYNGGAGAALASHAIYREIDNQENEEERSFLIGSAEIDKNKLKGLFKKAVSLFEKKFEKDDQSKTLQIGGFEVKSN